MERHRVCVSERKRWREGERVHVCESERGREKRRDVHVYNYNICL